MTDPVKLVSDATGSFFDAKDAARILTALTEDGWRIMRTEQCCDMCGGHRWERIEPDCDHAVRWVPYELITEEWTPDA